MERQKPVDPAITNWALILFDALTAVLCLTVANALVSPGDAAEGSHMGLYLATVACSYVVSSIWLKPLVNLPGTRFYQILERTFNKVLLTGLLTATCLFFNAEAVLLRALLGTFLPVFFVALLLVRMAEHAWFKRRYQTALQEGEDTWEMPRGLHYAGNRWVKRIFDILFSLVLLLTVYPVVYLIAFVYSKARRRGAVLSFYRLNSLNGKEFTCIKFHALSDDNPLNALPRFFCVLTGSMSIVGSRPYPAADAARSEEATAETPAFIGKAGLTGWATLEGYEDREEETELDNRYVESWSPGLDIFIILKGMWNLLFKRKTTTTQQA